jgi:hypothetical protein
VERNFEVSPFTIWKKGKKGLLHVTDRPEREALKKLSKNFIAYYINGGLCFAFAVISLVLGFFVFLNL